jgi:cation diffusion facilitator family transporter
MANGSTRVVYAALVGNVLVAASKYFAAALSGSSAMLTEAIHSTSDCTNQLLLLIGVRRGKLPADASHQFGYGMEIYFWTFVVAVLVLLAGGAYSIFRGVSELAAPHPISSPKLSLAVLVVSTIFEGASFRVGYKQYKKVVAAHRVPGQSISLIQFIQLSKDPSLYESLLEDGAALAGLAVAAAGIVASAYFGLFRADGAASVVIGMILVANGIAILVATRSLVAGEAVAPQVLRDLRSAVEGHLWSDRVADLATLHLGPSCILVAVTLQPGAGNDDQVGHEIERRLKATDPRILEVLFRLGVAGTHPPLGFKPKPAEAAKSEPPSG